MKRIFGGYTQRQLLIYLLLTERDKNEFIILPFLFPKSMEKKFKENYLKIKKEKYSKNKFLNYFFHLKDMKKYKKKIPKEFLRKSIIYGESRVTQLLSNDLPLYQLEDGIKNYNVVKCRLVHKIKFFLSLLFFQVKEFPMYSSKDKRIKKIYLTGLAPIPEEIAHKVEMINLQNLWNGKSKEEKEDILEIFSLSSKIIEKFKNRGTILLTQPISEENFVLEEEKIEIYKKALEKHNIRDIIIKVHPREKTNYRKYFPDAVILDTLFPFELVTLMEIKFERAITLFSTVALDLGDDIKVEWLGAKVHPKLEKRFGNRLDLDKFKK